MRVTLQKSKCNSLLPLCLLTLNINLGKSDVNTALQIPYHNWLGYGQPKTLAFAKVDVAKREHNDVCSGSLPCWCSRYSLPMLKGTAGVPHVHPTCVWHVGDKPWTVGAARAGAWVMLLQRQGTAAEEFPQGSPGWEQMEQPARVLAASWAHTWGAERTLYISQAECLGPQWMQIHPPPCHMCRAEQHSPLCTSSHRSKGELHLN